MEKCWFVLKQSHYPPPHLPKSGIGTANGATCLGHIIPDLINLDGVINRSEEGIKFTPSVPTHHTESLRLDWKRDTGLETGMAAGVKAPMRAGVPVFAEQQLKLAFERTEKNHKEFDTLDRYIIQVDRRFIRENLEDDAVAARIEQTKGVRLLGIGGQWSVFMITGIIVARSAKGKSEEKGIFEAMSSATTNAADATSVGVAANSANSNATSLSAQKTSDFVWAVRLRKIWKIVINKEWEFRTVSKGSTCFMNDKKLWRDEIERALSQELFNVGVFHTLDLPDEEGMIVY